MFERFTNNARQVVVVAQEEARRLKHNYIGTEHLLLGLLDDRAASPKVDQGFPQARDLARQVLESLGIDSDGVLEMVLEIIGEGQLPPPGHIPFTPRAKKCLELALREALQLGDKYVGTQHVLLGVIREGDGVAAQVLVRLGADLNVVRRQVIAVRENGPVPVVVRGSGVRLRNLSAAAREGRLDPVFGRQAEIRAIMQVLTLRTARCPLLVGEHGVGVSAVVHGFAQAIAGPDAPSFLSGRQVCELDLTELARDPAGTATVEARLDALLGEIRALTDTIVFLDHSCAPVHTPTRTVRAVTILEPMLASGELQVIAAATPGEQRECLTPGTLSGLFEPIPVRELPQEMTVEVLIGVRDQYEARHRVAITDQAIAAAVAMSAGSSGPPMPAKAIILLDRAAGQVSQRNIDTLPLRTAQQGLADIRTRKDAAIDSGDWDQVAALRDQEKHAIATLDRQRADTKNMPDHHIIPVTEHDIAEALNTNPDSQ